MAYIFAPTSGYPSFSPENTSIILLLVVGFGATSHGPASQRLPGGRVAGETGKQREGWLSVGSSSLQLFFFFFFDVFDAKRCCFVTGLVLSFLTMELSKKRKN